jgi:hypothetical protein
VKLDRFIIVTPNSTAAEEIRWATRSSPLIEIVVGKFEEIPSFDCVATAGNSFGLMDAGMDLAVLKFFGPQLQEKNSTAHTGRLFRRTAGRNLPVNPDGTLPSPVRCARSHHAHSDEHLKYRSRLPGDLGSANGHSSPQSGN